MACLFSSGLNCIFHWSAQSEMILKSWFNWSAAMASSHPVVNSDVSQANSFASELRSSTESLMSIKKNKGPRPEPWGTPAVNNFQWKHFSFRTTRWHQSIRNALINAVSGPMMLLLLCLKRSPSSNLIKSLRYVKENCTSLPWRKLLKCSIYAMCNRN